MRRLATQPYEATCSAYPKHTSANSTRSSRSHTKKGTRRGQHRLRHQPLRDMADYQEQAEAPRIPETPPTHRPPEPSHPKPEHNQRRPTRLTNPQEAPQTRTQRQRRPMRRPSLPLKAKLQPHRQERPHPSNQAEKEHDHTETRQPTMA